MFSLFGRNKKQGGIKTNDKTLVNAPDLVDGEETIVIDLTGETLSRPDDVHLELPEKGAVAPTAQAPAADIGPKPAAGGDTEVWSGAQGFAAKAAPGAAASGAAPTAQVAPLPPVVGWLVVISEVARGRSYSLRLGRNTIGRGVGNTVVLDIGDGAISSESHVVVAADPKTKCFFAVPGASTNLVYLDEGPLLEAREITDKAVLQLGSTRLVFVQFAGNYVDWG